jgi:parallel beta-helix repeat protein
MRFIGTFLILATVVSAGADAQVRRGTADLAALEQRQTISVSPRNVTLTSGGSEQFSATTMGDADVMWRATGGTISSTGVFTAGSVPGTYYVTALAGRASATVAVIVVAASGAASARPAPVVINPGDSIQAAVNASPAGTSFLIKRGVHRRQRVKPKDGMSFIGEAGAVLDGENVATEAFLGHATKNVTIRGLRITRYAVPNLSAALDSIESSGWVIEGNEIDHNINGSARSYGLRIGTRGTIRGNSIHHNGYVGIECYQEFDTLIEGNEVYANPPDLVSDSVGEAANMKFYDCGGIVIRGNYVHDSPFRGIWVDTSRPEMTIDSNRVINHGRQGIWYEVSYRGYIRNNYVENAGYLGRARTDWPTDAAILVSNSPDVSVLNNTVVNSLNAIMGHNANDYASGKYGVNELRNLLVQGNTIVMPRGQSGIVENIGTSAIFSSWNNRFIGNKYVLSTNATPFSWMGRTLDERQFQTYGQGTSDSYVR